MKRAKAQVINASFFQFYKAAHDIDDIYAAEYLLYGLLSDQGMQYTDYPNSPFRVTGLSGISLNFMP